MWIFAYDDGEAPKEDEGPSLGEEYLLGHESGDSIDAKEAESLLAGLDSDDVYGVAEDDDEPADPNEEDEEEEEFDAEDEDDDAEEEDEEEDEDGDESEDEEEDDDDSEDSEDEEDDESGDEEDVYIVRIDGDEQEVTLEELTSGYSRTADYTRKTTLLAQERAVAEAVRTEYGSRLDVLDQAIAAMGPEEVDWAEAKEKLSPEDYAALWTDHQRAKEQRELVLKERVRVHEEQTAESDARMAEYLQGERVKLRAAIDGWDDEKVASEEAAKLVDFAVTTYGFVDQDFSNLVDHRLLVIINDAMKYRTQQEEGKAKIRKKVKAAPKKVKPTGRKKQLGPKGRRKSGKKTKRMRDELAKSGRTADAADLIEHLLG